MTGRAAGYCAGYGVPGYASPAPGRGLGRGGRGGGWGRRNWYYATGQPGWARAAQGRPAFGGIDPNLPQYAAPFRPVTKEEEVDGLKEQADHFERVLEETRKRIGRLEAEAE